MTDAFRDILTWIPEQALAEARDLMNERRKNPHFQISPSEYDRVIRNLIGEEA